MQFVAHLFSLFLYVGGALYFANTDKAPSNLIVIFILDNRQCFFFYPPSFIIFAIWLDRKPLVELYWRWTFRRQSHLASWYVNSCQVILTFLSDRMVLAFVLAISRIKARQYIIHCLVFILVEMWLEIRSATSTPSLVWS